MGCAACKVGCKVALHTQYTINTGVNLQLPHLAIHQISSLMSLPELSDLLLCVATWRYGTTSNSSLSYSDAPIGTLVRLVVRAVPPPLASLVPPVQRSQKW
eukprot:SAG31_NODE_3280_length_4470_cov_7.297644_3_plen_101_part_00